MSWQEDQQAAWENFQQNRRDDELREHERQEQLEKNRVDQMVKDGAFGGSASRTAPGKAKAKKSGFSRFLKGVFITLLVVIVLIILIEVGLNALVNHAQHLHGGLGAFLTEVR